MFHQIKFNSCSGILDEHELVLKYGIKNYLKCDTFLYANIQLYFVPVEEIQL